MPKGREEPRFRYAHPKTLAGKLQRGLGTGFLEALAAPREVVYPILMACIRTDPALDIHLDHRDWYFGELAFRTEFDIAELGEFLIDAASDEDEDTSLTLDVLAHLARRGNDQADAMLRDYVTWGPSWRHVLLTLDAFATSPAWTALSSNIARRAAADPDQLPLFSDPFQTWAKTDPEIAALTDLTTAATYKRRRTASKKRLARTSTKDLLIWHDPGPVTPRIDELATRRAQEDVDLIEAAVSDPVPMTRAIALAVQAQQANFKHFELALKLATNDQRPPYATSVANWAVLKAPAEVLIPLGNRWRSSSVFRRRHLAWEILERHATAEDRPWLERKLGRVSATDPYDRFLVTTIAEIVAARLPGEEFPGLASKFDGFTYSYGRHYLAEALAVTDPMFPTTRAFTSLWDCESNTRLVAVEHVSLDVPGAVERLRDMAADPLEEDSRITEAVERRLSA